MVGVVSVLKLVLAALRSCVADPVLVVEIQDDETRVPP